MRYVRFAVVWGAFLGLSLSGSRAEAPQGPTAEGDAAITFFGSVVATGIIAYILYRFVGPVRRWVDGQ